MVRLRQAEAEEVEHSHDEVELAGDTQVEQVGGEQELHELAQGPELVRIAGEVQVDEAVEDQMEQPARDPGHAGLVDPRVFAVVVRPEERGAVDHRVQGKAHVGQHEEVRQRLERRRALLVVAQGVQVEGETEHEHGAEDRPDGDRPGCGDELHPPDRKSPPVTTSSDTRAGIPHRQMADADQHEAETHEADPVERSERDQDGRQGKEGEERQSMPQGQERMDHESARAEQHDLKESAAFQLKPVDHEQRQGELRRHERDGRGRGGWSLRRSRGLGVRYGSCGFGRFHLSS